MAAALFRVKRCALYMVTQDYAVADEGMKGNTCRARNTINFYYTEVDI